MCIDRLVRFCRVESWGDSKAAVTNWCNEANAFLGRCGYRRTSKRMRKSAAGNGSASARPPALLTPASPCSALQTAAALPAAATFQCLECAVGGRESAVVREKALQALKQIMAKLGPSRLQQRPTRFEHMTLAPVSATVLPADRAASCSRSLVCRPVCHACSLLCPMCFVADVGLLCFA